MKKIEREGRRNATFFCEKEYIFFILNRITIYTMNSSYQNWFYCNITEINENIFSNLQQIIKNFQKIGVLNFFIV